MMNIPKPLIEKINKNQIVIFVGAGLSMGSGLPSWKQLIINILEEIGHKESKSQKFKIALDDQNRQLCFFRVYAGSLKIGDTILHG